MVQTLRAAADRSTRVRRRQEKLCRRWLTDAYVRRLRTETESQEHISSAMNWLLLYLFCIFRSSNTIKAKHNGLLSKYDSLHIIFCSLWFWYFFFCYSFLLFSSPILSSRRLNVYHSSTHDVALECEFRMQV